MFKFLFGVIVGVLAGMLGRRQIQQKWREFLDGKLVIGDSK